MVAVLRDAETKNVRASLDMFDPLIDDSKDVLVNPYPHIEKMREHGPIIWSPRGNQWLVVGYDEANSILRSKVFGKRIFDKWKHPNLIMRGFIQLARRRTGPSMLIQDPPDHTRIRALVSSAFTPKSIHRLEPHLADICDNLIENIDRRLQSEGKVDLI
ncbi:MAG: cytochrome P450, partial [Cyanobacteria bacterium]|nr:cytochrome P450 [Cyanobacteriota bacterium]